MHSQTIYQIKLRMIMTKKKVMKMKKVYIMIMTIKTVTKKIIKILK